MSVLKLPLGLCDDLTSIIRDFWWGGKWKLENNLDWVGGIGTEERFNQAMLRAWRLIAFPDSLCARLLKAKYFPRGSLVDTAFCYNASSTWQSILHSLEILKKGIIWRVGNGTQIRIWRDPWIPMEPSLRVTTRQGRCKLRWVSELFDIDGRSWDFDKLIQIFNPAVLRKSPK